MMSCPQPSMSSKFIIIIIRESFPLSRELVEVEHKRMWEATHSGQVVRGARALARRVSAEDVQPIAEHARCVHRAPLLLQLDARSSSPSSALGCSCTQRHAQPAVRRSVVHLRGTRQAHGYTIVERTEQTPP